MSKRIWYLILLLAMILLVGGLIYSRWEEEDEEEEETIGEYQALTIKNQDYTIYRDFTATIETEQPANIRPQISGRITKICVKEG